MSKTNFFIKYFKNINFFINNLLEKNLNKLNSKNLSFLFKNNKIILTFVALIVFFTSYLLLPTFYNQSDISKELKNQLQNKFNLNFKFSQEIKYNFFPRPHFTTIDTTIINDQEEISKISKLKIFVKFNKLSSIKNIEAYDIILENANFDIDIENYNFFLKLLDKSFKNENLTIKNSNIFFKNLDNEVLFINKVLKLKYYYEQKELRNIFYLDSEIFNIPFTMETFFNKDKSKVFSKINLKSMKLQIENELTFENEKKIGKSEFILNKLKRNAEYQINKNSTNFRIFDRIDQPDIIYKGNFNFKPFYGNLEGYLNEINLNTIFGSNAVIAELLKTEIFNNKNIDFKINILADNVYKNANFKNINFSLNFQEGLIDTDDTKFKWRDFADFELFESLVFVKNGELILDGKIKIYINDYNKIYKFLLTPKNYRNKIKEVDFNFTYNFDQRIAELKDIKIDNKINQSVNKILNNVFFKKEDLQNKIYFKNLLNEAIKNYAG